MEIQTSKSSIHWFRKGLRIHDNPSLVYALKNSKKVFPIFILDPKIKKFLLVGSNRWRFLLQSLVDLDTSLRAHKSRLLVIRGDPIKVFPVLIKRWNISLLTYEYDTEPYAKQRDMSVNNLMKTLNVSVDVKVSHTLYDIKDIIAITYPKSVPLTFQGFQAVMHKLGLPSKPLEKPDFSNTDELLELDYQIDDMVFDVPTLHELNIDECKECGPCLFPGGESEALKRLEKYLKNTTWICKFSKPDTSPNSLEPSTTVLSPYLKFGCLSPRKFYFDLKEILDKNRGKCTQPPTSLEGQLFWREFYYAVGAVTPNFGKMEGNPICKQINWSKNDDFIDAWKNGRTGFPFIDACMIQLRTEGWIHHLARHAVACFLTRGDLWQSWEIGASVFEEYLLDADWSLNAGNWMWLSASCFFYQYFKVYSPIAFGKKTDPDGLYIKKYIPALNNFPKKFIYEPWTAPLTVQQLAKCIIGKDYPKPIVDHDKARNENLQKMKEAYKKSGVK